MSAAIDESAHQPLGELLVERGVLTSEQLASGLEEAARRQQPLGATLVAMGFVGGPAIARALATQSGGFGKSEYGFAVGYHHELPVTSKLAEPPITAREHRRESAQPAPSAPSAATPAAAADTAAEGEERLLDMARQLGDAAVRVVDAELARDAAQATAGEAVAQVAALEAANAELEAVVTELRAHARAADAPEATSHSLFYPGSDGYAITDRPGGPPAVGEPVEIDGRDYVVVKVAPSPRECGGICAYLA